MDGARIAGKRNKNQKGNIMAKSLCETCVNKEIDCYKLEKLKRYEKVLNLKLKVTACETFESQDRE